MITVDIDTFCEGYQLYDVNVILRKFIYEISNINKSMKENIKYNTTAIIPFTTIPYNNKINICIDGISKFISTINIDTIKNIINRSYLNNKDINYLVSIPVISYFLKITEEIISNLSSILLLLDDKFEMIGTTYVTHNILYLNLLIDKINYANNEYLLLNAFLQMYQRFDYIYFYLIYEKTHKYIIRARISGLIDYGEMCLNDYECIINKYTTKYNDNITLLDSISMLILNSKIMFNREKKNNTTTVINNLNNKIEGLKLCLLLYSKNKDEILEDINNLKNVNLLSTSMCEHVKKISGFNKEKDHDSDSDSDSDSDYY